MPATLSPSRFLKPILWVLAIAVVAAVAHFLDLTDFVNRQLTAIEGLDIWGPVAFIGLYILATVFFVPGSALTLASGTVFGMVWGSVYVSIGSTLGATAAFLVGRYIARDWVAKKIEGNEKFAAIDCAVEQEGWKIVGLTRLSPVFPFSLLNYAFSLTKVRLWHYMLASWIGMMPATVMFVYIGSLGKAVTKSNEKSPGQWTLIAAGLLATITVTVFVTKLARKALQSKL